MHGYAHLYQHTLGTHMQRWLKVMKACLCSANGFGQTPCIQLWAFLCDVKCHHIAAMLCYGAAITFKDSLHASVEQRRHRVLPVPVGLSSKAFLR